MRSLIMMVTSFVLALTLGLGSAWYMIDKGSAMTTGHVGPWSVWYAAGHPRADPYTKAHLARTGRLPITSTGARYYFANTDSAGERLLPTCEYVIDGWPLNAAWWSMAVYDETGRLMPNKAGRHSYNRTDVLRRPDGSFRIVLARSARPGNWLPISESGSLQLMLRVYGPRDSETIIKGRQLDQNLPRIRKLGCA